MRLRALISAALTLVACAGFAPASNAQSLEVHESGTGNQTVDHWRTYWGSYDRDSHQTKKIRITVTDLSRRSPDGEVRVYFIGRNQPQLDLFIYNHSVLQVHFGGDMEVRYEIDAPSLFLNEQHYNLSGRHYSHGAVMEGWIAEGRVGSHVFGTVASNQNLLAIARSDALQKMIVAAGIHEPQRRPDDSRVAIQPPSKPPAIPTSPSTPAPPPKASPSSAELATLIVPIEISIPYGKTTLPRGTKLRVVSRDSNTVTVVYLDRTITVPVASTDLK
jgi:hypothetical protein